MNRNFPVHQSEKMAQLHISRTVSIIRYTQANSSSSEVPSQSIEGFQVGILKDTNNKNNVPSHIQHLNIPNEFIDSIKNEDLRIA